MAGSTWVDELTSPEAPRGTSARRAAGTLTIGLGAGVAGALSQWGPAPQVTPYAVHVALCLVGLAALPWADETATPGPAAAPLRVDLRLPRTNQWRFWLVVLPLAPGVFAAAGLAYALVLELVELPRLCSSFHRQVELPGLSAALRGHCPFGRKSSSCIEQGSWRGR